MKDINLKVIIVILVLTSAILFGANRLFDGYKLNNSLQNNLISIEGLDDVKREKSNGNHYFELTLDSTGDLRSVFLESRDKIEGILGESGYKVKFEEVDSHRLNDIYDEINLALYEAIETGEFVELGKRVANYKQSHSLDRAQVRVDSEYIYLVLSSDDDNLYRVIERKNIKEGGEING